MMVAIGRFRVPSRPAAVARFFLADLHSPRSGRERLAGRLARRLPAALGLRLLAAVSPSAGEPAGLARQARSAGLLAAADLADGEGAAAIELAGHEGRRRGVVFVFPPRAERPARVLKLATDPAAGAAIAAEADRLERTRRALSPALAATIPRVLERSGDAGCAGVALEARPGRPLQLELARGESSRERLAERFEAAGDWLGRFHRETAVAGALPEVLSAALSARCPKPREVPLARAHGDYWPRNVLVDEASGRISGVVDWEAPEAIRPPHGDLFDFALSAVGCSSGPEGAPPPERVLGLALLAPGSWRDLVSRFFAGYIAASALERSALEALLRLYLEEIESERRAVSWIPAGRRREVVGTWRNELETANRSAFSG